MSWRGATSSPDSPVCLIAFVVKENKSNPFQTPAVDFSWGHRSVRVVEGGSPCPLLLSFVHRAVSNVIFTGPIKQGHISTSLPHEGTSPGTYLN